MSTLSSGTKVKIKSYAEIKKTLKDGCLRNVCFPRDMELFCGREFEVSSHYRQNDTYLLKDSPGWNWCREWLSDVETYDLETPYISMSTPEPDYDNEDDVASVKGGKVAIKGAIPNGSKVQVVDSGYTYSSYDEMAKKMHATKWISGTVSKKGDKGFIVTSKRHEDHDLILYLFESNEDGIQTIISGEGLKVIEEAVQAKKAAPKTKEIKKEEKVTTGIVEKIQKAGKKTVSKQGQMAKTAATLEAARLLNNQLVKIASKKLPLMIRGYADTALGKAIIANALFMGMEVAFPDMPDTDVKKQVASAAVVQAYTEFLASFKAEELLEELFDNAALKKLTDKISAEED